MCRPLLLPADKDGITWEDLRGRSCTEKKREHMINKKGRFVMFPIETISARMLDYYVGRNDALIIDLREEKAYAESHVRGAVNIPYETLENRKDLPMNKILVFYCDRGGASMAAAREFVRRGYRTRSVIGGFTAYRGRNLVSGDR